LEARGCGLGKGFRRGCEEPERRKRIEIVGCQQQGPRTVEWRRRDCSGHHGFDAHG
jgi:hypothetical protein